ncbi:MAG: substrate-binding domain-containing protein, partial [Deltaproteobacteria bacterium]|nr:substrate-binding domain-containing protein [Deltaproteobacteria bacterium]
DLTPHRDANVARSQRRSIVDPITGHADDLAIGLQRIHQLRHELAGELRVGAPVEFGAHRLPALLATFRAEHPAVRFTLTLGHPSVVVPRLEHGQLDLAFADVFDGEQADSRRGGLQVVGVMDEALIMVASPDYEARVLAGSRAHGRLIEASYVAYQPHAPALYAWFRHHLGRGPTRLDVALVVESVPAVIAAVEHGMGLGLVPLHTVSNAIAQGRLCRVRTRRRPLSNRVSLLRLLDKVPSRAERALVRHLVEALGVKGSTRDEGSSMR